MHPGRIVAIVIAVPLALLVLGRGVAAAEDAVLTTVVDSAVGTTPAGDTPAPVPDIAETTPRGLVDDSIDQPIAPAGPAPSAENPDLLPPTTDPVQITDPVRAFAPTSGTVPVADVVEPVVVDSVEAAAITGDGGATANGLEETRPAEDRAVTDLLAAPEAAAGSVSTAPAAKQVTRVTESVGNIAGTSIAAVAAPTGRKIFPGRGTAVETADAIVAPLSETIVPVVDSVAPLIGVVPGAVGQIGQTTEPNTGWQGAAPVPLREPVDELTTPVIGVLEPTGDSLQPVLAPVPTPVLDPALEAATPVLTRTVESIAPIVASIVEPVAPVVTPIAEPVTPIADPLLPVVEPILQLVLPELDSLAPILTPIVEPTAPAIVPIVEPIAPILPTLLEPVTLVLSSVADPMPQTPGDQTRRALADPVLPGASTVRASAAPTLEPIGSTLTSTALPSPPRLRSTNGCSQHLRACTAMAADAVRTPRSNDDRRALNATGAILTAPRSTGGSLPMSTGPPVGPASASGTGFGGNANDRTRNDGASQNALLALHEALSLAERPERERQYLQIPSSITQTILTPPG